MNLRFLNGSLVQPNLRLLFLSFNQDEGSINR